MSELPDYKRPLHTLFMSTSFSSEMDILFETLRSKWKELRPNSDHALDLEIAVRISHLDGKRKCVHRKTSQVSAMIR